MTHRRAYIGIHHGKKSEPRAQPRSAQEIYRRRIYLLSAMRFSSFSIHWLMEGRCMIAGRLSSTELKAVTALVSRAKDMQM